MGAKKVLKMIEENDVKWVDLRFTDPKGKEQHTTVPAARLDADALAVEKIEGAALARQVDGLDGILGTRRWDQVLDLLAALDADFADQEPLRQEDARHVARRRAEGPATRLVSIVLDDVHAVPLGDEPIYAGERIVGQATSAAYPVTSRTYSSIARRSLASVSG